MQERNIIAIICLVFLLIVAFTPFVPIMLESMGYNNIYVERACVGVLSLTCSWGFIWAVFKKDDIIKPKKEGKLHMAPIFLITGAALVVVAWFTDLPLWITQWTGTDSIVEFSNEVMTGGLMHRVFTSLLTSAGVLLIRYKAFYREDNVVAEKSLAERELTYRKLYNYTHGRDDYD